MSHRSKIVELEEHARHARESRLPRGYTSSGVFFALEYPWLEREVARSLFIIAFENSTKFLFTLKERKGAARPFLTDSFPFQNNDFGTESEIPISFLNLNNVREFSQKIGHFVQMNNRVKICSASLSGKQRTGAGDVTTQRSTDCLDQYKS